MVRRLIAQAARKAALVGYSERALQPDEVRINVDYASPKHGSELAEFRGESPHIHEQYNEEWKAFLPREGKVADPFDGNWVLGNQWVGRIIELGANVSEYSLGEQVCGYGGIAETQVCHHSKLLKMPADMPWANALCYDPCQFALGGIRDSHVRLGDRVAVIGLGAIGQIAAQLARLAGASHVAVIDPIERRRNLAVTKGADEAFDPGSQDVGYELKKSSDKAGVDVIIETSANQQALQASLRGLAYGGTIAYVGWARPFPAGLDLGREAHFNNANIVFSRACSEPLRDCPRWTFERICSTSWEMLSKKQLDCEGVIDPIVPFTEAADAYEEYVDQHPERSIKLGIQFN